MSETTFRPLWHWCLELLPSRPGGYSLKSDKHKGQAANLRPGPDKPTLLPGEELWHSQAVKPLRISGVGVNQGHGGAGAYDRS